MSQMSFIEAIVYTDLLRVHSSPRTSPKRDESTSLDTSNWLQYGNSSQIIATKGAKRRNPMAFEHFVWFV